MKAGIPSAFRGGTFRKRVPENMGRGARGIPVNLHGGCFRKRSGVLRSIAEEQWILQNQLISLLADDLLAPATWAEWMRM